MQPFKCLPRVEFIVACWLLAVGLSCGISPRPVPPGEPTFDHVVLVVLENHSFSEVIGNPDMPYLNGLAQQYGLAAQYYGVAHPSLPNYFMLTTGRLITRSDSFTGTVHDDSVVRELDKAGKSWKAYEEDLPSVGYMGNDVPPYVRRHNPFSYFSDLHNGADAANLVSFSQFVSDLANNSLPQYSFIAPNVNNDAHNGTLAQADVWLQKNIVPLISSPAFQQSGLLIITFDEGDLSDTIHDGGRVATIVVSSKSKKNYVSQRFLQHASTLRLTLIASGVDRFPGAAAYAEDMDDFFAGQ